MQLLNVLGQVIDLVVEQVQLAQMGQCRNLAWNALDLISGHVQQFEID